MKLIIITSPDIMSGEASAICCLLDAGVDRVHLRKPYGQRDDYERIIMQIPEVYRGRVVVHDYFELHDKYMLGGIHLNSRNSLIPSGFGGTVSCSCHSFADVTERKHIVDYMFLSPIFDSISKAGYLSAFSEDSLHRASADGIIDSKVMALGGVTFECIPLLERLSFGGAVMLGDVWSRIADGGIDAVCTDIKEMKNSTLL